MALWVCWGATEGGGWRNGWEKIKSSVVMSSASESEASVSETTRGEPINGASKLQLVIRNRVWVP